MGKRRYNKYKGQRKLKSKKKGSGNGVRISDYVANYILELLNEDNGCAEIRRNELAPEKGYMVESRRGGGGYIRITRIECDRESGLMHLIHSIGSSLDGASARSILNHLSSQQTVEELVIRVMAAALSDQSLSSVPQGQRDLLRAALMKNMLITQI